RARAPNPHALDIPATRWAAGALFRRRGVRSPGSPSRCCGIPPSAAGNWRRAASAATAAPHATPTVDQAKQDQQRWNEGDVDDLDAQPKGIDLVIQLVLHAAQLRGDRELALAELFDLAALLG